MLARGRVESRHVPHARPNSASTDAAAGEGLRPVHGYAACAPCESRAGGRSLLARTGRRPVRGPCRAREFGRNFSADCGLVFPASAAGRAGVLGGSQRRRPARIRSGPQPKTRAANLCGIARQPPATGRASRSGRFGVGRKFLKRRANRAPGNLCTKKFRSAHFFFGLVRARRGKSFRKNSSEPGN